jgi:vancomycin resistance protein YoaR
MAATAQPKIATRVPTRMSAAIFRTKTILLQLRRGAQNTYEVIPRHMQDATASYPYRLASSTTRLRTDPHPTEAWYETGKIQNLRIAASRLDACIIPSGQVFSFWKQVGRASQSKGYVPGRMLQEGCMIPAIGGGLCQLSNALYQVALDSGSIILERHPHSRLVPGSATAAGRDATVAWNYIDLRFRSAVSLQLRTILTETELQVSLNAVKPAAIPIPSQSQPLEIPPIFADHACESCGTVACFRHNQKQNQPSEQS